MIPLQRAVKLSFEELMALDTGALLVQILGVTGLDNVHINVYYGAPLANDRNGYAMEIIISQIALRNLVIKHCSKLLGGSYYYLGFCCIFLQLKICKLP